MEHVTIQRRTLLGKRLLGRVVDEMASLLPERGLDAEELASMLSAVPLEETNLVELRAVGTEPAILQTIVNTWADGYEALRREQIAGARDATLDEVQEEYDALQQTIAAKADELAAFREAHDIVSLRDSENRPAAKLRGLNNALNEAQSRLVEAEARREALAVSIERGQTVVPRDQQANLSQKMAEARKLETRLDDLLSKYTRKFIESDPELRDLPKQLEDARVEIEQLETVGQRQAIAQAEQEVAAARAAVARITAELDAHERAAATFADLFSRHEALHEELAELRGLASDKRERIAAIEARNFKKYPPVDVVQRALLPQAPVRPDYHRDAGLIIGGSLALALFLTWLVEYLFGRQGASAPASPDLRIIGTQGTRSVLESSPADSAITHTPHALVLESARLHVLAPAEVRQLLAAADPMTAACIALLLSGLSDEELALLDAEAIDLPSRTVRLEHPRSRDIRLPEPVVALLGECVDEMGSYPTRVAVDEFDEAVTAAAIDAGLEGANQMNAAALRASYLVFLVQQGVRLSELHRQTGRLSDTLLKELARHAPPGDKLPLAEIDTTYPLFATGDEPSAK
ncbi:MAG: hypothetical protein RLW61_17670 [Gammaproteobacteria bacterium]